MKYLKLKFNIRAIYLSLYETLGNISQLTPSVQTHITTSVNLMLYYLLMPELLSFVFATQAYMYQYRLFLSRFSSAKYFWISLTIFFLWCKIHSKCMIILKLSLAIHPPTFIPVFPSNGQQMYTPYIHTNMKLYFPYQQQSNMESLQVASPYQNLSEVPTSGIIAQMQFCTSYSTVIKTIHTEENVTNSQYSIQKLHATLNKHQTVHRYIYRSRLQTQNRTTVIL